MHGQARADRKYEKTKLADPETRTGLIAQFTNKGTEW